MTIQLTDDFLQADGVWAQVISSEDFAGRPALFLDRDGVVVEEVTYLHRAEDVRLIPGTTGTIMHANALGIPVVIVTNQAGIGRRYYDWRHFAAVQGKILSELAGSGATVDAVFACPFHEDARRPYHHANHPARKPNPGMLLLANELMGVDLSASWIVGDRASDLRAGRNAGCAGGIHVRTGHGIRTVEQDSAAALTTEKFESFSADAIDAALDIVPFLRT